MSIENILSSNLQTWAILGVVTFLVKTIMRVNTNLVAVEIRLKEHERRIGENDLDIRGIYTEMKENRKH